MSILEIHCPKCDSSSIKKDGKQFCCNHCGTWFMITKPKKKKIVDSKTYQIKYGLITLDEEKTKLPNFNLKSKEIVLDPFYVFNFVLNREIKRGNNIIYAHISGYAFYNPVSTNFDIKLSESTLEYKDFLNPTERDCYKILHSPLYKTTLDSPDESFTFKMLNDREICELEKEITKEVLKKAIVKKSYNVQSRSAYDFSTGRTVSISFRKKDISFSGFVGCFVIPLMKLEYVHPNSKKVFRREILGCSGEVVFNDLICSGKTIRKKCSSFPEVVCPICGNLVCSTHQKHCETCGTHVCTSCIKKKGLFSKHYYCKKCAK